MDETHLLTFVCVNHFKGSGGCGEAAFSGDAHGEGDRSPESQTHHSQGQSEGTRSLQGESPLNQ